MSANISQQAPPPAAGTIASEIIDSQAAHRMRLIKAWGCIGSGTRVLEIGCGQGTCTEVLAEAVGTRGHVDAVDPAPADYGAPMTLGDAQAGISAGPLGPRITWHMADPLEFLRATPASADGSPRWDVAVLCHCIWYFTSAHTLEDVLRSLHGRAADVAVAEYALSASGANAVPHLLAALARGTLECLRATDSGENIQTPLGPAEIRAAANRAGWAVDEASATVLTPDPGLLDGHWETSTVVSPRFLDGINDGIRDDRVKALLRAAREATVAATDAVGGVANVHTMDVWAARFVPTTPQAPAESGT